MDEVQVVLSSLLGTVRGVASGFVSLFAGLGPFRGLVAFLVGLALLVAGSRLVARYAIGRDFVLERSEYDSLKFHRVIGAVLAVGASGVWTWAGIAASAGLADPAAGSAAASLVLAVGAVPLLGLGLGCRLRIEVDVLGNGGSADTVSSHFVLGLMEKIGSGRPRGLEYPHSMDASAFAGAIVTAAPEASWVKALLAAVRLISFAPPWRIDIALQAQEAITIQITRNGRKTHSEVIIYSELFPQRSTDSEEDRNRALLTAAACFILLALADCYPHMRDGLAGAHRWRSVAFQVLAGSNPWSEDLGEHRRLLAGAVDEDPRNKAAWLGYLQASSGFFGSSRQSLRALIGSLEDLRKSVEDDQSDDRKRDFDLALEIRLLYSLALAYSNLRLRESRDGQASVVHQGLETAAELIEGIKRAIAPELKETPLGQFAARLQPNAGLLYLHLLAMQDKAYNPLRPHAKDLSAVAKEWSEGIENSSLLFLYNRACWRVEEGDGQQKLDESLRDLELAVGLEDLRRDAASDPSFRTLRSNRAFLALTTERPRLESLEALKVHAPKLALNGITSPLSLLERFTSDTLTEWDTQLGAAPGTSGWLRGICELEERCPERGMALSWTNLLGEQGIHNVDALIAFVEGLDRDPDDERYMRLAASAGRRSVEPPLPDELRAWATQRIWKDQNRHAALMEMRLSLMDPGQPGAR